MYDKQHSLCLKPAHMACQSQQRLDEGPVLKLKLLSAATSIVLALHRHACSAMIDSLVTHCRGHWQLQRQLLLKRLMAPASLHLLSLWR